MSPIELFSLGVFCAFVVVIAQVVLGKLGYFPNHCLLYSFGLLFSSVVCLYLIGPPFGTLSIGDVGIIIVGFFIPILGIWLFSD